jgi:hypothetical protein
MIQGTPDEQDIASLNELAKKMAKEMIQ